MFEKIYGIKIDKCKMDLLEVIWVLGYMKVLVKLYYEVMVIFDVYVSEE